MTDTRPDLVEVENSQLAPRLTSFFQTDETFFAASIKERKKKEKKENFRMGYIVSHCHKALL